MMWGYYSDNGGMAVWGLIMSLVWLGLAVVALWALIRWLSHNSSTPRSERSQSPGQMSSLPSPLGILKTRYARGEIDAATYRAMREQLEEPAGAIPSQTGVMPGRR